jgi:hypothetical protein
MYKEFQHLLLWLTVNMHATLHDILFENVQLLTSRTSVSVGVGVGDNDKLVNHLGLGLGSHL